MVPLSVQTPSREPPLQLAGRLGGCPDYYCFEPVAACASVFPVLARTAQDMLTGGSLARSGEQRPAHRPGRGRILSAPEAREHTMQWEGREESTNVEDERGHTG